MNLDFSREPPSKGNNPRRLFNRLLERDFSILRWSAFVVGVSIPVVFSASDAIARVGGGHSYSGGHGGGHGGGGHGGNGGGGDASDLFELVWLLVRLLFEFTVKYPVIAIPVEILVIATAIYWFNSLPDHTVDLSSSNRLGTTDQRATAEQQGFERAFAQLRRFDPNFSEIIFTDFCYTLYGRAHDARGRGAQALDLLSPYLSEQARASLLRLNSLGLKAVEGVIVGEMRIVGVGGLDTPTVGIRLLFEANYTELGDGGQMSYYVREGWELERQA